MLRQSKYFVATISMMIGVSLAARPANAMIAYFGKDLACTDKVHDLLEKAAIFELAGSMGAIGLGCIAGCATYGAKKAGGNCCATATAATFGILSLAAAVVSFVGFVFLDEKTDSVDKLYKPYAPLSAEKASEMGLTEAQRQIFNKNLAEINAARVSGGSDLNSDLVRFEHGQKIQFGDMKAKMVAALRPYIAALDSDVRQVLGQVAQYEGPQILEHLESKGLKFEMTAQ
jgi:hypothetical protein